MLRIKYEIHSENTLEIGTTIRDSIPEVWVYRDMELVWGQRDLASAYVLHYCHTLVPNFRDWSIGVWPEVHTKEEKFRKYYEPGRTYIQTTQLLQSSYILIVWECVITQTSPIK